jgi:TatD DNase family protein
MLVDSHCHLDYGELSGRLDEVMGAAQRAGVGAMLTIGTELGRFEGVYAIAEAHPNIWCSVGIHPHEAALEGEGDRARLLDFARRPKAVAIGESGLDYYYDKSPRDRQQANFRRHIEAAVETGLPLVVHARDADEDLARMLEAGARLGTLKGVLHCFSSSRMLAERALALGFYISLSGIVTFKGADDLRETVKIVPLDRLLVETDAPYLAPVPLRGKKNEPAFVVHVAAKVAELKGVGSAELSRTTTANFFRLFDKARPMPAAAT